LNYISLIFYKNASRLINITRQPVSPKLLAECSIFHSSYPRIPRVVRKYLPNRHLQTVYDLIPLILDKRYCIPGQSQITSRIIDSIQPNDWITTISDSTRNDLLNRLPNLKEEQVVTIYLGANQSIFYKTTDKHKILLAKKKYRIPHENYFLSLNSLLPHKNIVHLIHSFNEFLKQEKIQDLYLVICGGSEFSINQLIKSNSLTSSDLNKIYFTGFIEDYDLASIYSDAIAFIFPSLYEGFGLPVLEAMQCGCPVIASNTSSLPEIIGSAGLLVSPTVQTDLCQAMTTLYYSSTLRKHYADLAYNRANLFNWQTTIENLIKLYKIILHS